MIPHGFPEAYGENSYSMLFSQLSPLASGRQAENQTRDLIGCVTRIRVTHPACLEKAFLAYLPVSGGRHTEQSAPEVWTFVFQKNNEQHC